MLAMGVLRGLRDKYVEMRALRLEDGAGESPDPRPRLRALAARFPGSLREIDRLPLDTIEARIDAIEASLAGEAVPRWAETISAYHGWMRAALRIRRQLPRGSSSAARAAVLASLRDPARAREASDEPEPRELADAFEAILSPPRGRLSQLVFARLSEGSGALPGHLEEEAFLLEGARSWGPPHE